MVSADVVTRARASLKIQMRYDAQELARVGGKTEYIRRDWTPAQKRRMRKKLWKVGINPNYWFPPQPSKPGSKIPWNRRTGF